MPTINIANENRKPHEEFLYFMRGRTVILQQLNLDSNSASYGQYIAPHNWKDALLEDNSNNVPTLTGKDGIEEGLLFEYSYAQDLSGISSGSSTIDISDFLIQAVVDYIKAQLIEDAAQFQVREYYMKRFRDRVSQYAGSKVAGARIVKPNPHGVI
jgi:hypothetical protein